MLRYTEIPSGLTVGIHHDVAGFDITVHEPRCSISTPPHADNHRQRPIRRHRFLTHLIHDVRDRAVLHHQKEPPILRDCPRRPQLHDGQMLTYESAITSTSPGRYFRLRLRSRQAVFTATSTGHLRHGRYVREPTRSECQNPLVAGQHRGNPTKLVSVTHRFLLQRRVTRQRRTGICPLVIGAHKRSDLTDSAAAHACKLPTRTTPVRVPASQASRAASLPDIEDADLTDTVPSGIRGRRIQVAHEAAILIGHPDATIIDADPRDLTPRDMNAIVRRIADRADTAITGADLRVLYPSSCPTTQCRCVASLLRQHPAGIGQFPKDTHRLTIWIIASRILILGIIIASYVLPILQSPLCRIWRT